MRRHVALLLGLGLGMLALAAPITLAAADPANPGYTFSRTPDHGKPGTVIHVEGGGCSYEGKPYQYAETYMGHNKPDGSFVIDAEKRYDIADDGSFSGDFTTPRTVAAGKYVFDAECVASDMVFPVADSHFTVDGSSPTPTPTRKPSPTPTPSPTHRHTPSRSPSVTPSASHPTSTVTTPPVTPPPPSPSPSQVATIEPPRTAGTGHGAATVVALLLLGVDAAGLVSIRRRRTG